MKTSMNKKDNRIYRLVSVLVIFIIWEIVFFIVGNRNIFPSFIEVIISVFNTLKRQAFYIAFLNTSLSSLLAFILAFVSAVFVVYLTFLSESLKVFFDTLFSILKSFPVASATIVFLIWARSVHLPFFVAYFMTLPVLYEVMLKGSESVRADIIDSAVVQGISKTKIFFKVVMYNIPSSIKAGVASSLSISFKSCIAAEIIALVRNTIGNALYEGKIYFDIKEVFAITFIIIIAVKVYEIIANFIINRIIKTKND